MYALGIRIGAVGVAWLIALATVGWAAPNTISTDFTLEVFATVPDPVDLAFDSAGNLFVGRQGSGAGSIRIHKVSPDGQTVSEFGDPIPDPDAVIVDIHGHVTTPGSVLVGGIGSIGTGGHITQISPDGLTTSVLAATASETHPGPSNPQQFAFDSSGRLLWGNCDNPPRTFGSVSTLAAGLPQVVADAGAGICFAGLAVAPNHGMFLTDLDAGAVVKFATDGTLLDTAFVSGLSQPQWLTYDAMGQFGGGVLVSEVAAGRIVSIDPDTGATTLIAENFSNPFGLTFGPAGCLFVAEFTTDTIWRMCPKQVAPAVYWSNRSFDLDTIQRLSLDGAGVAQQIVMGLSSPLGLALDAQGGLIYWADASFNRIQRANLTGSGVVETPIDSESAPSPQRIALDVANSKVYWTDAFDKVVRRADLDGTDVEDLVAGIEEPQSIALDLVNGKIYWEQEVSQADPKIRRANLNIPAGETPATRSDIEDLILAPHAAAPRGIALDAANGKIYWVNRLHGIYRANLDLPAGESPAARSDVEPLITSATPGFVLQNAPGRLDSLADIALDRANGMMYWSIFNGNQLVGAGKIQRANLDFPLGETVATRTDVEGFFVGGGAAENPFALAVLDATQIDTDYDGLSDADESARGTDPNDSDTDDDGLLDGTEVDMAMHTSCPDPLNPDSDGDSLLDGHEVASGLNPCNSDTDGDGLPDDVDPTPTDPGATSGFLEQFALEQANVIRNLDAFLFNGPNGNANQGRRNALANRAMDAATAIATGDIQGAIGSLQSLLDRIDGQTPPPDWMDAAPSTLVDDVMLLISLLEIE